MSLSALLLLSVVVLLPGLGATVALWRPGEAGLPTRMALAAAFGYALWAVPAFALAILRVLNGPALFTLVALATVGLWWFGLRRGSLAAHVRAVRDEVRADPWTLVVGLVVLVGLAVVRGTYSSLLDLRGASPFRYWADGLEMADAGRIPAQTLQWGMAMVPTVSKVLLNAFNAGSSFVLGTNALHALGPLLWLSSVGLAAALWAFGREVGLRRTAALLPVLLIANRHFLNPETTEDLAQYKAETFGRLVAVAALLLAIRAIRTRAVRGEVVVAGALFGIGAGTHLVPVIVALAFLGLYAVAVLVMQRDVRRLARTAAVMGGVAAVVAAAALFLPRGDIGFGGATGGDEAYARFGEDFDPTRFFLSGNLDLATRPPPPGWYYDGGFLFDQLIEMGTGRPFSRGAGLAFAAAGLVLAGAMLWRFPDDLRPLGVAAWGLGLVLFLVAVWFSARSDLYILARFGLRRMYDYASVPFALLGLALLEAGLAAIGRVGKAVPAIAGAAVVLAGALLIAPSGRADPARIEQGARGVAPLEWIRDNVPCEARILSNQRTAGSFQAVTGRVGVLEGMAPYLRPEILVDVVELHLATREFFADPGRHAFTLALQGVDYVVVTDGPYIGAAGAEFRATPALDEQPFLRLAFESPGARVYAVVGSELPTTDLIQAAHPDPADFPGYTCATGPLR